MDKVLPLLLLLSPAYVGAATYNIVLDDDPFRTRTAEVVFGADVLAREIEARNVNVTDVSIAATSPPEIERTGLDNDYAASLALAVDMTVGGTPYTAIPCSLRTNSRRIHEGSSRWRIRLSLEGCHQRGLDFGRPFMELQGSFRTGTTSLSLGRAVDASVDTLEAIFSVRVKRERLNTGVLPLEPTDTVAASSRPSFSTSPKTSLRRLHYDGNDNPFDQTTAEITLRRDTLARKIELQHDNVDAVTSLEIGTGRWWELDELVGSDYHIEFSVTVSLVIEGYLYQDASCSMTLTKEIRSKSFDLKDCLHESLLFDERRSFIRNTWRADEENPDFVNAELKNVRYKGMKVFPHRRTNHTDDDASIAYPMPSSYMHTLTTPGNPLTEKTLYLAVRKDLLIQELLSQNGNIENASDVSMAFSDGGRLEFSTPSSYIRPNLIAVPTTLTLTIGGIPYEDVACSLLVGFSHPEGFESVRALLNACHHEELDFPYLGLLAYLHRDYGDDTGVTVDVATKDFGTGVLPQSPPHR